MRIALVYDRVVKWGGAERILCALHDIWPDAPLYTGVYHPATAPWASTFDVRTSSLFRWPVSVIPHEFLPLVTPILFSSFSFDSYDVVISITSSDAKHIVAKPGTLHICYCLTPPRYLWSGYQSYVSEPGYGKWNSVIRASFRICAPVLRRWDILSSNHPDRYIAISNTVSDRILKYYHRRSTVIYPPVHVSKHFKKKKRKDYYLLVSRLVPYKHIEDAIFACKLLRRRLVIIGRGVYFSQLKSIADDSVEFITDYLTDEQLCCYYQECKALIFPGEEDFGIVMAESMGQGCPVIAYGEGGSKEIVIPGKTGELYYQQDAKGLAQAIKIFENKTYSYKNCVIGSSKFSYNRFVEEIKSYVLHALDPSERR